MEREEKGSAMETKALKKQMGAAIAMVLVAAIALAASTYAWFVSNNTVKATTASVSAQSNAPFLKIAKTGEALTDTSATQVAGANDKTELYPSQWAAVIDQNTYQFESAYGKLATESMILDGSRFAVGGVDSENRASYALKQSFDIGTSDSKAGSFNNLKVSKIEVNVDDETTSAGLKDALCVLIKCGDQWGVYKADNANGVQLTKYGDSTTSVTNNSTDGVLASSISAGNKITVDVYVFYDGSASAVYSNNIANLKNCGVTISFTATPVNTEGTEVAGANNEVTTRVGA